MYYVDEENVIYRYKYLPLTKHNQDSLKVITEGTVKFTCPLDFNDPFDCRPYYDEGALTQLEKNRPDLVWRAAQTQGLSPAQRLQKRGQLLNEFKQHVRTGEFNKNMLRHVGVLSLSRNALDILMWSHYASYHQGFVVEFRIPSNWAVDRKEDVVPFVLNHLCPMEVTYSSTRPIIRYGIDDDTEQALINDSLLTKSDHWKYEQEERVIDSKRGPDIYPYYRDDVLASIIAGIEIREDLYKELKKAVEGARSKNRCGLTLYRAREVKGEYRITVPRHPRLP